MNFWNIHFLNPIFIYAIPFVILAFLVSIYFIVRRNSITISFYDDLKKVYKFSSFFSYLKIFIIVLIISVFLLLAWDPNKINTDEKVKKNGIDIVLALDVSKSMEATDLKPSRMESAKSILVDFLDKFETDRVWLVIFAWKPFSSVPLTFDYDILKENISLLTTDSLNQQVRWLNGTAIWDALLLSKNLFENKDEINTSWDREKVVILLTDWDANVWLEPSLVAKVLAWEDIKVYTVGIWSENGWYVEYNNWFFNQRQKVPPLNEKSLKEISDITSWEFFRATDNDSFKNIFDYLEKLEKNDIKVKIKKTYSTYYKLFLYVLIFLILVLLSLESLIIRK